ncbi:MAG: amidohydrolase family protein [Actinomycetota bacterium]
MSFETRAMVCAHHHLYSSLARGMPAPSTRPDSFISVLQNIWWKLDVAIDLDTLYWSAALGAAEALCSGTTAIIDHHESPLAIDGSLDVIADACAMVGVKANLSYGVTDRWDADTLHSRVSPLSEMTEGAKKGLRENERFLASGGRGMVGVHAAFTCSDETLHAATALAKTFDTGVHIHVAEGSDDKDAGARLESLATNDWLLVHAVHLDRHLAGTIVHNPRSNMNNAVGYAQPQRFTNDIALGTDGIGADMLEEARLAYVRLRESDISATPDVVWKWLKTAEKFFPEIVDDTVTWSYDHTESPWHAAFTPGIRCVDVVVAGECVVKDGNPTKFDMGEIRAKAAEAATSLHKKLS